MTEELWRMGFYDSILTTHPKARIRINQLLTSYLVCIQSVTWNNYAGAVGLEVVVRGNEDTNEFIANEIIKVLDLLGVEKTGKILIPKNLLNKLHKPLDIQTNRRYIVSLDGKLPTKRT